MRLKMIYEVLTTIILPLVDHNGGMQVIHCVSIFALLWNHLYDCLDFTYKVFLVLFIVSS